MFLSLFTVHLKIKGFNYSLSHEWQINCTTSQKEDTKRKKKTDGTVVESYHGDLYDQQRTPEDLRVTRVSYKDALAREVKQLEKSRIARKQSTVQREMKYVINERSSFHEGGEGDGKVLVTAAIRYNVTNAPWKIKIQICKSLSTGIHCCKLLARARPLLYCNFFYKIFFYIYSFNLIFLVEVQCFIYAMFTLQKTVFFDCFIYFYSLTKYLL